MAHNISTNNKEGVAEFAYVGARPWHGLGLQVPQHMKTKEAIVAGRLDWTVGTSTVVMPAREGVNEEGVFSFNEQEIPGHKVTYRQDTNFVLGLVGSDYEVIQNVEAFGFFDKALGKGAACIETVGSLDEGRRIFIMAKMPEIMEVVPGDRVEHFLLLTTSHDGSFAVKILFTPVRVVCQNTLSLALKGAANIVSIKHTKNAKDTLDEAPTYLKKSAAFWTKAQAAYKTMAAKQMDGEKVKKFLEDLFPTKKIEEDEDGKKIEVVTDNKRVQNIRQEIKDLFDGKAKGADLAGTTGWGMFNAVTDYIDHSKTVRTRKNGTKPTNWEASVFGLGVGLRQKAGELLLQV